MKRRLLVSSFIAVIAAVILAASAPSADEIQAALDAAYAKYKILNEGKNADYIPALGTESDYRYFECASRKSIRRGSCTEIQLTHA